MATALDRWILRLIRAAYQLGYDDAKNGEGASAFYSRPGPYDDDETPQDDEGEKHFLRKLETVTRGQAR